MSSNTTTTTKTKGVVKDIGKESLVPTKSISYHNSIGSCESIDKNILKARNDAILEMENVFDHFFAKSTQLLLREGIEMGYFTPNDVHLPRHVIVMAALDVYNNLRGQNLEE